MEVASKAIGLRSLPRRQLVWTMVGVMLALFLGALDQTIVGTAMPRIIADLNGFAHYTWVTTAYIITSAVVIPITGKLTDMYGRKPFYIAGLIIFTLASLLSGLSQSMTQLIAYRGIQGIGAGIMMANAFTVIADLFPPAERGKYQGFVSAVFGLAAVIGPALGGLITDSFSWHWIFFVNVPLGLFVIALFIFFFPPFRPDNARHKIDYAGMVTLTLAVVPLLLALSWGGSQYGWLSVPILGLLGLFAVMLIAFLMVEGKNQEPIIPLALFKNRIVAVSELVVFLTAFGMFGAIIFVPLFYQGVLGATATVSGGFLTPMILGQVAGSFISGQLLSRAGGRYRLQGVVGIIIMGMGTLLLALMHPETSFAMATVNIVLTGFGLGMTMPLYTITVQNAVPYNVLGVATSTIPFIRSVGGSVGLAIFGSVMTSRFAAEFTSRLSSELKSVLPAEQLSSLASNPQTLVSPQAQAQIRGLLMQAGPQGSHLFDQLQQTLKQALSASLNDVFIISFITVVLALAVHLFIKEIPLRKEHDTAGYPGDASPNR